jgi:hypothetical protein
MPDYGLGLVQPSMINQQLAQGVQTGIGLGDARVAAMDRQLLLERQAQADAAAKAQQEAALASRQAYIDAGEKVIAGGFKSDDVLALRARFPEAAKHYADIVKTMDETTKRNHFHNAAAVFSIAKNDPIKGAEYAERLAEAAKNTPGQEKQAEALLRVAGQIRENPGGALLQTASFISEAADTPKEFAEVFDRISASDATLTEAKAKAGQAQAEEKTKAATAKYAEDQALANLGYTKAQTNRLYAQTKNDAARLALDEKRLLADQIARQEELRAKMGEIPEGVRKDLDKAVAEGSTAKLQAASSTELAKKFRQYSKEAGESWKRTTSSGLRARAGEMLAAWTGFEDDVSAMRKQYDALVASQVITNLPPGSASDTDIALVRGGFPDSTSDPEQVANFLDAMANVQRATARQKRTESDYLAANRSLAPARTDIVVDGVLIPAGTSFDDASAIVYASKAPQKPAGTAPLNPADLKSRSRFTQ